LIISETERVKIFPFLIASLLTGCVATNTPLRKYARDLQKGRIKDDSSFVYALPYEQGSSHFIVQGYYSAYSHKNRAALDFKMKKGTKVLAARSGVVIRLKEDGEKGGLNKKYRQDGNLVVIQHEDGTRAGYWHLQKDGVLVNIGDTVQQGQVIALSGKTGYSALPHLHFLVWSNKNGQWQQVPTRFHTANGDKYLRPFRYYKNPPSNLANR
jgi:murein DD-endopeptidase MepM/ murein hydrolase activator NlpD